MAQLVFRLVTRGCRLGCLFDIKMWVESLRTPIKRRYPSPRMLRVIRSVEGRPDHNILLLGRPPRTILRTHQHYLLFLLVRRSLRCLSLLLEVGVGGGYGQLVAEIGEDAVARPRKAVLRHALFGLREDLLELGLHVLVFADFVDAATLFSSAFVEA